MVLYANYSHAKNQVNNSRANFGHKVAEFNFSINYSYKCRCEMLHEV